VVPVAAKSSKSGSATPDKDAERAFRLARAGCRKFFNELNDLGWDLQLQAQKVEREAQESEIKS
jgi:hypothetical protein